MTLNSSGISTYEKNALWTEERSKCSWCVVDNYSKIQKNSFYKNFYSQNCRFFPIHCSVILEGKINIDNTSENIKCGNYYY